MPENLPSRLIIRYLSNEATEPEEEQLLEWVSRNRQNQEIFLELSEAWENKNHSFKHVDVIRSLRLLDARIDGDENKLEKKAHLPWMKIAASVLLLISFAAALLIHSANVLRDPKKELITLASPGHITTLELPDGSTVMLNRHATLQYPKNFLSHSREVYLTGEAFFSVRKDPAKPFIVHTGNVDTEVLGTSFNVRSGEESLVVTVSTGKVKISDGTKTGIVLPDEQIRYDLSERSMQTRRVDVGTELAWTSNTIIFDDLDLDSASRRLAEHFRIQFHFDNEAVKKCRITGKFSNETLKHILDAIAFSTEINYEITDGQIRLSGKGCP